MKKVIIIGGGISGLTAGILLQKKGFKTVIYEKNNVIGGLCSGWKKDGYFIDNCIHWLTGTNKNSSLYKNCCGCVENETVCVREYTKLSLGHTDDGTG